MLATMRPLVAACILAALAAASTARADERAECARAYEGAQRLRQRGENRKALDAAERCAQPTCPALLADECKPWANEIRQQLSRLEVHVIGSGGCALPDAVVEIDRVKQPPRGELLVEPGIHEIRTVDAATKRVADATISVVSGEHRVVELGLAPAGVVCGGSASGSSTQRASTDRAAIPKLALGLGIAGSTFLVSGIVVGIAGAVKRSDLDACKPSCNSIRIDDVRTYFVVGDILAAVGLLTLGAATAVFFLGRDPDGRSAVRAAPRGIEIRF
jgi:hypothetical protein